MIDDNGKQRRNSKYSNALKKEAVELVCVDSVSTSAVAKKYNIPLKTLEKWITAYNKDPKYYDIPDDFILKKRKIHADRYNNYNHDRLIRELKRRDLEIDALKSIIATYETENKRTDG